MKKHLHLLILILEINKINSSITLKIILVLIIYLFVIEMMMNTNHYVIMFIIMIISGFLTTMNIYVNSIDDIRFSLNDVYMVLLMTGWMFLFMGIIYKEIKVGCIGAILVICNIWCIRTQFMINEKQYLLGMIPHHSMAVLMSEKLLQQSNNISSFLNNLIKTQSNEITYMKSLVKEL